MVAELVDSYEVIVVYDGGRDRTGEIADRLGAGNAHVRVVHHPDTRGYGAALRSGLAAARYPLVAVVDGGNQFDFGELAILLRALDRGDIVCGYRITQHGPVIRRVYAFIYIRLARALFLIRIRDDHCGFDLHRRC